MLKICTGKDFKNLRFYFGKSRNYYFPFLRALSAGPCIHEASKSIIIQSLNQASCTKQCNQDERTTSNCKTRNQKIYSSNTKGRLRSREMQTFTVNDRTPARARGSASCWLSTRMRRIRDVHLRRAAFKVLGRVFDGPRRRRSAWPR